ncbi:MAG: halocyanin domain-containing protein [Haloarculaceae archaeon]
MAGAAGTAAAQDGGVDYGGWFDDVSNFDGTVDKRGQDTVEVSVGAQGNGGNLAFDPPAVMVSPGTTVRWTWTGQGGAHNVVADDGSFQSGSPVAEAGTTFEHTFEETGIHKYYCQPHKPLGMKGAVVVRESGGGGGGGSQGPTGPPSPPDYGGWFDDVSNFDGTVSRLDQDTVTVTVGAQGNGGNLAFGPPAIRVSPGTTVRWEWSGNGGAHNVVADDGSFQSGSPVAEAGTTFEHTFEETGIYKYYCQPHKPLGMKGAVVVGAPPGGGGGGGGGGGAPVSPGIGIAGSAVLLAFLSPLLFAVFMRRRYDYGRRPRPAAGEAREPEPAVEAPVEEPDVELGHDEYDPWGTVALVAGYLVIVVLMWVFMYFVEFLGRVSVIG